ncbi:MAG: MFS transporter [Cyanobacteria bacterium P01_F01_bin.150]
MFKTIRRGVWTVVQKGLPKLDHRVWILAWGRLLSQIGNGFTFVYAPIFFANQVGLSATAVGIGIGSGSIAGVLGRFLGGTGADSPRWGRRSILLWSAAISAIADLVLSLAFNFPNFILGNILMGFGIGLYWPATEAMVADLTTDQERNEAFALVRWADHVGLSVGIVLGGALIELTGLYRALFVVDGVTYLIFFGLIYWAISETHSSEAFNSATTVWQGWSMALRDRRLQLFVVINSVLTMYMAQGQATLPLYFSRFVQSTGVLDSVSIATLTTVNAFETVEIMGTSVEPTGLSTALIGLLFTWNLVLTALLQLPVSRWMNRYKRLWVLGISALAWGISFCGVFITGIATVGVFVWAGLTLAMMAIATVIYLPAASAYIVEIAPESLRGIYFSVNSQCWAIGYFIGPTLGGWMLDQGEAIAHQFWIALACSVALILGLLSVQKRLSGQSEQIG